MNGTMTEQFLQQALRLLSDNPDKKYCYPCWGQVTGMASPEGLYQRSAIAAALVQSSDYIAEYGTCYACSKDAWTIFKLKFPSGGPGGGAGPLPDVKGF